MAIPPVPNPCPTLKPGLSLGAPEHAGFVNAFNWLVGIFRAAKENFVFSLNGASGDVSIVGGEGIAVSTSGTTITISLGEGDTSDKEVVDRSGGGPGDLTDLDTGGDPTPVPGGDEPSSGGGVPDYATGAFSYDFANRRIRDGVVMVGRQAYRVTGCAATDGEYRVVVVFATDGGVSVTLEQGDGFAAPTDSTSYIPVMTLSGGDVLEDMRGAFVVPAYD